MSTTRVKICGLREAEHARVAIDAGADLVGVVFAPSRRQLSVDQARAIRSVVGPRAEIVDTGVDAIEEALARRRPLLVGVFAGQSPDEINRIATAVDLDLVQLSGGEHPSVAARLQRPVIRAIHIDPATTAEAARAEAQRAPESVPMLDTKSAEGGGSGVAFDWAVAAAIAHSEQPPAARFLLAGGLDPTNVEAAIARVGPWGVDVSSGVETDGVKDSEKIRAFLAAARAAEKAPAP